MLLCKQAFSHLLKAEEPPTGPLLLFFTCYPKIDCFELLIMPGASSVEIRAFPRSIDQLSRDKRPSEM